MKNKEIIQLANGIQHCGSLKGVKLSYAIIKNSKTIQKAAEPINAAIENLKKEHAEKGKDGSPILKTEKDENGKEVQFYDIRNMDAFKKDYDELMDVETEISFHKVKKEELPEDITTFQMQTVIEFLED